MFRMLGLTALSLATAAPSFAFEPAPLPFAPPSPLASDVITLPPAADPVPAEATTPPPTLDRDTGAVAGTYVTAALLGGYVGGTAGYAVGDAATDGSSPGRFSGAVGGGFLGGALGASTVGVLSLIQPDWSPEPGEPIALATTSTMGAFAGHEIARAFIPGTEDTYTRRVALASGLGALGGAGVGVMLMPVEPEPALMGDIALGSAVGWQAAAGVADVAGFTDAYDNRKRAPFNLVGATVGGVSHGFLHHFDVAQPSPVNTAITMANVGWVGAMAPRVFSESTTTRQRVGGGRLGLAGGYELARVLSPVVEKSPRSAALQGVGIATGNALGAGIPLALGNDPNKSIGETRAVLVPMMTGSLVGQVAGAALAPHYDLSDDDAALITAMGAWTAYQSIGWTVYASRADLEPPEKLGWALTAAGTGTAATVGLAPLVEVSPPESVLAVSAGGWGTFYGGWIGHLARLDPDAHWAVTLGSGNAALVGTIAVGAGEGRADWVDVALVDGAGIVGGATGTLVAIVASEETDSAAWGGLVGSTVGLGTGTVLALRRDVDRSAGTRHPLVLPGVGPIRTGMRVNATASPWVAPDGSTGFYVSLTGVETR